MSRGMNVAMMAAVAAAIPLMMGGCQGVVDPAANTAWQQNLGNTSITVFPTVVRAEDPGYDSTTAMRIGEFFTDEGLADVTVSAAEVPITGEWQANQAAMLEESTDDFARYIADHPIETEYALMAEYLIGGRGLPIGIHCYILDAQGRPADAVLLNSHWAPFADANPATLEDCTTVLIGVLRDDLTPSS